jgi:hypothetical protein
MVQQVQFFNFTDMKNICFNFFLQVDELYFTLLQSYVLLDLLLFHK